MANLNIESALSRRVIVQRESDVGRVKRHLVQVKPDLLLPRSEQGSCLRVEVKPVVPLLEQVKC